MNSPKRLWHSLNNEYLDIASAYIIDFFVSIAVCHTFTAYSVYTWVRRSSLLIVFPKCSHMNEKWIHRIFHRLNWMFCGRSLQEKEEKEEEPKSFVCRGIEISIFPFNAIYWRMKIAIIDLMPKISFLFALCLHYIQFADSISGTRPRESYTENQSILPIRNVELASRTIKSTLWKFQRKIVPQAIAFRIAAAIHPHAIIRGSTKWTISCTLWNLKRERCTQR